MNDEAERRHSKALEVELISDPDEKARQEARNVLLQFDSVIEQIEYWLHPERPYKSRPSAILNLHRVALDHISSFAGLFRPAGIEIGGSRHAPPPAHLVPELMEQMCDYINDNWQKSSPVHLSAFAMWRLNWIHPFVDGNGRTARAYSYLVLCIRLHSRLPGTNTIPEQIAKNKRPYYEALEAADTAFRDGKIDVGKMDNLLEQLLANQLLLIYEAAKGSQELPTGA